MSRIIKELIALALVLALGGVLVQGIRQVAATAPSSPYDTFQARVNAIPVQILSPAAGQVLSLSSVEGSTVTQGQELATIQVFDRTYRPPVDNQLFKLQGDKLAVLSPVTGVVGRLAVAPLSMVGGNQSLLDIYAPENTDLHVLIPQGAAISSYRAFYAATSLGATRYPINIEGAIPTLASANVAPKTTLYRATCAPVTGCLSFINVQQVLVIAEKVASG
jgi:hypothetical protein